MRAGATAILLLLLLASPASAASGGLSLEGPAHVTPAGPTLVQLDLTLRLRGVVCAGDADVSVHLRVARADGAKAALSWDRVHFRLTPHAAAESWTGSAEVALRIDPVAASGAVEIVAQYSLPSSCVSLGGATSGSARHAIRVDTWTIAAAEGDPAPAKPSSTPPRAAPASDGESDLPAPVIGAILGMCVGGLVVVVKRVRARSASFEP